MALLMSTHAFGQNQPPSNTEPRMLLPPKKDIYRGSIHVGLIAEQIHVTGSQYAYTKNGNAVGAGALPANGKVLIPTFDMACGVTGGLDCYFDEKNWGVTSRFDWLSTTGRGNAHPGEYENVIPVDIWRDQLFSSLFADLGVAGNGRSRFEVTYYNVNLDLNRVLYVDSNFSLEPHMGIKLAFIYDKVNTQFSGNGADAALSPVLHMDGNKLHREQKTNFWGFGPSTGFNSKWSISHGFSLFFEGTASILLGYTKAKDEVSYSGISTSKTYASSPDIPTYSPTLQTLLGLKYEWEYCKKHQKFSARLGWDSAFFWNQWTHINVVSESTFNSSLDTFQLQQGDTFGLSGLLFDVNLAY